MNDLIKKESERYQELFNFFKQEHDIRLTIGEMDDIINQVDKHLQNNTLKLDGIEYKITEISATNKPKRLA